MQKPLTYTLQNNGDGTTTLIPAEGTIVDPGTSITAAVMNKLETQYDESINYFKDPPVTWTNLTLQNGVQVYQIGSDLKYAKVGNFVIVKGAVKNITVNSTVVATLPAGYRPPETIATAQVTTASGSNAQFARWLFSSNGNIQMEFVSDATITSTDWFPVYLVFSVV